MRSFFWPLFSCILIGYRNLLRKSPYSTRIQGNTDKKNLRVWTPLTQCIVTFSLSKIFWLVKYDQHEKCSLLFFFFFFFDYMSFTSNWKLSILFRKPDKTEIEEPLDACPYCSYPVPQTQLDCPECKQHLPYCIITVWISVNIF